MQVYLPPISADDLQENSQATSFDPQVDSNGCPIEVSSFTQGAFLEDMDLNVFFWDETGQPYQPYQLTYAVYFFPPSTPDWGEPQGKEDRIPLGLRTGRYRPNFRIDDAARTGNYKIIWKYLRTEESTEEEYKETLFTVESAGIYDPKTLTRPHLDVAATVDIIGVE